MTKTPLFSLIPLFALAACGGGGAPAESPSNAPTTPAATGADAGVGAGTADAGPPTGDLADNKKAFVADCSKQQPGTEGYCSCAWDVARETYGDDALRVKGSPSTDDLAKIHVKVASACASQFPPEVIQRAFMSGCAKDRSDMAQYCSCTWTELVGQIPATELVAERAKGTDRYQAAMRAAAKKCGKLRPAR